MAFSLLRPRRPLAAAAGCSLLLPLLLSTAPSGATAQFGFWRSAPTPSYAELKADERRRRHHERQFQMRPNEQAVQSQQQPGEKAAAARRLSEIEETEPVFISEEDRETARNSWQKFYDTGQVDAAAAADLDANEDRYLAYIGNPGETPYPVAMFSTGMANYINERRVGMKERYEDSLANMPRVG